MSKLMIHLAMLPTKAVVNAFTWTTLPLYAAIQRPWRRLKLSKSFGVQATKDSKGRIIYSRPSPTELKHPFIGRPTLNEMLPLLNPAQEALGFREVISEQVKFDPKKGKSAKVEGKNFKKIELAKYYQWYTVGQVIDRVDSLARGFKEMGVAQGEKVIIYAENSVEWFCLALALQRINAITVTLPSILNNDGVLYGINQSKSRYLIISHELLPRIEQICSKLENLNKIIYILSSQNSPSDDTKSALNLLSSKYQLMTLDQLQQLGNQIGPYDFPIPHPDDTTLIVYTSGTTGNPKGVMMSHRNLHETILNFIRFEHETKVPLFGNTTFAAYLPMSHLLGYVMNFASFLSKDSKLALCSASTILDSSPAHIDDQQLGDFSLLKPQFIAMVPLVLNRLVKDIYRSLAEKSPLAPPLFNYLMDYKIRWTGRGFNTPIINRLVCQRINRQFGGNVKAMLVSSAPLHAKTQAFVQAALNIKLLQYYGATEVTAGSHMMLPSDLNCGEVGVPMHSFCYYLKDWPEGDYHVTDKPNSRGEIVLGGPNIAQGYYDMPEQTEESFKVDEEGTHWFETGDIGEVLPNGTLKIIDRKKDLTKLANGKFVSLGKIESGLRSCTLVENICICTNPYSNDITAIVSPNHQSLISLAQQHSLPSNQSLKQLCTNSELIHHVHLSITLKGQELGLSPKEIPTTITLVPEEWTADNNLLTAALKLKRKQVHAFYSKQIEQMFEDTKSVE